MFETVELILGTNKLIMITAAVMLGLLLCGLLMQVVNYKRTCRTEATILKNQAKMMADIQNLAEEFRGQDLVYEMHGQPISLEELIERDLMSHMDVEDPDNLIPPTAEELERMMKELKS